MVERAGIARREAPRAGIVAPPWAVPPHPEDTAGLEGLPGIGPARARAWAAFGVTTRRQLLLHLPSRYRERPEAGPLEMLQPGARGALAGTVVSSRLRRRGRRSTVSLTLECEGGGRALLLLFNRAYLAKSLGRGTRLWAAGRLAQDGEGLPRLLVGDFEVLAPDGPPGPPAALLPLYRLPPGVPPRVHRRSVAAVLSQGPVADWRAAPPQGLPGLDEALRRVHQPADLISARRGRDRLALDEAFATSLQVALRRRRARALPGRALPVDEVLHRRLLQLLPHRPTGAQLRVLQELRVDLAGSRPMARLLQGDVGSGKTMVAFYLLLAAVARGRQAALMAPTEILAEQHARELARLLRATRREVGVALITGRGPAGQRAQARRALQSGAAALAVGTHGLQSASLRFADLAVTVIDEQQRFGVHQRSRFRTKGAATHLLVMTATPIPRTLSLTAYGELDVSVLDELPPGRSVRTTRYVPRARQPALWREVAARVAAGERGYVVCPSIEAPAPEDGGPGHSVEATLLRVRDELGAGVRVGAVHGRMDPERRDAVLEGFREGRVDVLVATVLVEVGLDVPEATFVVLPDPSRFGLATLHQIRGRVGRGRRAGTCWLLGPVPGGPARERVRALVASEDGFALAERDLALRGPGEMLGTAQSGLPRFVVLDPVADVGLLARARAEAFEAAHGLDEEALRALQQRAFGLRPPPAGDPLAGG